MREGFVVLIEVIDLLMFYMLITGVKALSMKAYCFIVSIGVAEIIIDIVCSNELILLMKTFVVLIAVAYISSRKKKFSIFLSILWISFGMIAELLASSLMMSIKDLSVKQLQADDSAYIISLIISRFFILLFVTIYRNGIINNNLKRFELYIPYLLYNAGSIVAMFIIIYEVKDYGIHGTGIMIAAFIMLIMNLLVLFFNEKQQEQFRLKNDVLLLNNVIANQEIFYEAEKQKQEKEKKDIHDMKNYLLSLKHLVEKKDWDKLKEEINNKSESIDEEYIIKTGNPIIDVVVNAKYKNAEKKGIKLQVKSQLRQNINIQPAEISVLLGNALDNAIENTKADSNAIIVIDIICEKGYFRVSIENPVSEIKKKNRANLFDSTKKESGHGYGLLSIKKIVEQYDGVMELECDECRFVLKVILFIEEG